MIDFDDIAYDEHADLLYDLAEQVVRHFPATLPTTTRRKVLRLLPAGFAASSMCRCRSTTGKKRSSYEVKVRKGFTELSQRIYTVGRRTVH